MSGVAESELPVFADEPAGVQDRSLWVAARLLAGATAFLFVAFLFAYFYLRSLNNAHLWRPKHVDPSQGFGAAVLATSVLSAAFAYWGLLRLRAGREGTWRAAGLAALGLGLAAVGLQFGEYTAIGFGPLQGGYASVFLGWTGLFAVVMLLALYWLETLIAGSARGLTSDDARAGTLLGGAEAFSFYWAFLVGTGVVAWVVLYVL